MDDLSKQIIEKIETKQLLNELVVITGTFNMHSYCFIEGPRYVEIAFLVGIKSIYISMELQILPIEYSNQDKIEFWVGRPIHLRHIFNVELYDPIKHERYNSALSKGLQKNSHKLLTSDSFRIRNLAKRVINDFQRIT